MRDRHAGHPVEDGAGALVGYQSCDRVAARRATQQGQLGVDLGRGLRGGHHHRVGGCERCLVVEPLLGVGARAVGEPHLIGAGGQSTHPVAAVGSGRGVVDRPRRPVEHFDRDARHAEETVGHHPADRSSSSQRGVDPRQLAVRTHRKRRGGRKGGLVVEPFGGVVGRGAAIPEVDPVLPGPQSQLVEADVRPSEAGERAAALVVSGDADAGQGGAGDRVAEEAHHPLSGRDERVDPGHVGTGGHRHRGRRLRGASSRVPLAEERVGETCGASCETDQVIACRQSGDGVSTAGHLFDGPYRVEVGVVHDGPEAGDRLAGSGVGHKAGDAARRGQVGVDRGCGGSIRDGHRCRRPGERRIVPPLLGVGARRILEADGIGALRQVAELVGAVVAGRGEAVGGEGVPEQTPRALLGDDVDALQRTAASVHRPGDVPSPPQHRVDSGGGDPLRHRYRQRRAHQRLAIPPLRGVGGDGEVAEADQVLAGTKPAQRVGAVGGGGCEGDELLRHRIVRVHGDPGQRATAAAHRAGDLPSPRKYRVDSGGGGAGHHLDEIRLVE